MDVRRARLGWSIWALALLAWALQLGLWVAGGFRQSLGVTEPSVTWNAVVLRLSFVLALGTLSTFGVIIVARQPRNPVGWTASMLGLLVALTIGAGVYATSPVLTPPGGQPPAAAAVAWAGNLMGANTALIVPLLLLFPDGRLPSPRWRAVLWLAGAATCLNLVSLALMPGPMAYVASYPNPLGLPAAADALALLRGLGAAGLVAAILLGAAALVLRFRRARGDERQQLKWVVFAAAVWAPALGAVFFAPRAWLPVVSTLYGLVLLGFVVSLGLSVLKYRLYDIDLVISRTLVYGVLAIGIGLVYVGVVAGAGLLVGTRGEPDEIILSLLATAVVAIAFQPLREQLQRLANRLVYGERATPYEVLSDFSRRLAGALTVDAVLPRIAEAAARGVGADRGRVRIFAAGEHDRAVAWPASSIAEPFEHTVPVLHQGQVIGEIAVARVPGDPLTPTDTKLLLDLASQAGPALTNVRLDLELQGRLRELQASRQRIVAAQDDERRRLERDIHDGAQQQLVALAVNVRLARELVHTDPQQADSLMEEVGTQANEALATLRELARGIFPAVLADQGLAAALESPIARSQPGVTLVSEPRLLGRRFSPEIESAVYFCCLEALQNRAKHAPDAPTTVELDLDAGWLRFAVVDAGPGFDTRLPSGGTGLAGMADRLAAVGGSLEVRSQPGQGTRISGRVPVERSAPAADGYRGAGRAVPRP